MSITSVQLRVIAGVVCVMVVAAVGHGVWVLTDAVRYERMLNDRAEFSLPLPTPIPGPEGAAPDAEMQRYRAAALEWQQQDIARMQALDVPSRFRAVHELDTAQLRVLHQTQSQPPSGDVAAMAGRRADDQRYATKSQAAYDAAVSPWGPVVEKVLDIG